MEFPGDLIEDVADLHASGGFHGKDRKAEAAQVGFQRGPEHAGHGNEAEARLPGWIAPGEFKRGLRRKAFGVGRIRFAQGIRRFDAPDLICPAKGAACEGQKADKDKESFHINLLKLLGPVEITYENTERVFPYLFF